MIGQYLGDVKDKDDKSLGFALTHLDPDRKSGHILYSSPNIEPRGPRLAKMTPTVESDSTITTRASPPKSNKSSPELNRVSD